MKWNKDLLGIVPACILWAISLSTFVIGLSFDSGSTTAVWMGIGLALSTTVLQILGNGKSAKEQGPLMFAVWIASYILGISSSAYALTMFLGIPNQILDWIISISIGVIVEIVPEPAFVRFYGAFKSLHLFKNFTPRKASTAVQGQYESRRTIRQTQGRSPVSYYDASKKSKWDE